MNLAEKCLQLRTQLGLSQEELAQRLEVSRQSVSKWETGQSIPELDKLIKLADLFQMSVDELVRDGEPPRPQEREERVVYLPCKNTRTPTQIAGIVVVAAGAALTVIGLLGVPVLVLLGIALVLLGLPLLLARRHPWLISGWLLVGGSYLILNRWTSGINLRRALQELFTGQLSATSAIALVRLTATVALMVASTLVWRRKGRK